MGHSELYSNAAGIGHHARRHGTDVDGVRAPELEPKIDATPAVGHYPPRSRGLIGLGRQGLGEDVARAREGIKVPPRSMSDDMLTLVPALDRPSVDDDDETSALAGRTTSSSLLRSPGGSTPRLSRSIR